MASKRKRDNGTAEEPQQDKSSETDNEERMQVIFARDFIADSEKTNITTICVPKHESHIASNHIRLSKGTLGNDSVRSLMNSYGKTIRIVHNNFIVMRHAPHQLTFVSNKPHDQILRDAVTDSRYKKAFRRIMGVDQDTVRMFLDVEYTSSDDEEA